MIKNEPTPEIISSLDLTFMTHFSANNTSKLRIAQAITTGPRHAQQRSVKRSRTDATIGKADRTGHEIAKNECDIRADTICAGKNFRMISTTGMTCDMHGSHHDFEPMRDVPVARVATAYKDDFGATYILIINEALYFGSKMDHSLINPNQIRHFGIPVSDDAYDRGREFGIAHKYLFIPFETEGSTVFFESYVPTDNELDTCPNVVLTRDHK